MAITYKTLAQSAPSATTDTNAYTVPSATQTIISTIFVCNRGDTTARYRIAIRPAGETLANKHYIVYDVPVAANSTDTITSGITMAATDVLTVRAETANFSFNIFGSEIA